MGNVNGDKHQSGKEAGLAERILDRLPDAYVLLGFDFRCQYVNESALRLFGKTRQACLGNRVEDFWPVAKTTAAQEALLGCIEKSATCELVLQFESPTEVPKEASVRFVSVPDGALLIVSGVSQGHAATELPGARPASEEEDVAEVRNRCRLILEYAPVGIAVHFEGKIVFINQAGAKILGAPTPEALIGRSVAAIVHPEKLDAALVRIRRLLMGEAGLYPIEDLYVRLDGSPVAVEVMAVAMTFRGKPAIQVIVQDITERRRAAQALREKEELLSQSQRIAHVGSWFADIASGSIVWSEEAYRIFDVSPQDFAPDTRSFVNLVHPEDQAVMQEWIRACVAGEQPGELEFRRVTSDGTVKILSGRGDLQQTNGDSTPRMIGTVQDITERKLTERALLASEERHRTLFEQMAQGVVYQDTQGAITDANPAAEAILGLTADQMRGKTSGDHCWNAVREDGTDFDGDSHPSIVAMRSGREVRDVVMGVFHPGEGKHHWISICAVPQFDHESGSVSGVFTTFTDITAKKQDADNIQRLNHRLRQLAEVIQRLSLAHSLQAIIDIVRNAARQLTGADGATFVLREGDECHYVDEDAIAPLWKGKYVPIASCIAGWVMTRQRSVVIEDIYSDPRIPHDLYRPTFVKSLCMVPIRRSAPIGAIGNYWARYFVATDDDLTILQALADATSVAMENVDTIERLRASEERYRGLVENLEDVVFTCDSEGVIQYASASISKYGFDSEEVIGQSFERFVVPADLGMVQASLQRTLAGQFNPQVFRVLDKAGRTRIVRTASRAVFNRGTPIGVTGVLADLTEQTQIEEQLRVAQRMEAVGRLAGGVAHDFNNLLAVILNYTGFAVEAVREGDPLRDDLIEIAKAGERAAALTRQLLAFSRKQVLEPTILDLNRVATDLEKMLRRLIGEDLRLSLALAPNLGLVKADLGQIEQVIVNLVVNARDAMPNGGNITIETANVDLDAEYAARYVDVRPGEYVLLAITDTGCGMDDATRQRAFEPFFTTKPKDKGTGLGLSTVYGIIKQSGGNVLVYSEPGKGTTLKTYLPRVTGAPSMTVSHRPKLRPTVGTETVLVVEDEEAVRNLTARILRSTGFNVIVAAHGGAAILLCEQFSGEIHLLLTDIVMPVMGGIELAKRLCEMRPRLRILYMSGYSGNAISQQGDLESGTHCVWKPFSAAELLRKVRETLEDSEAIR